MSPAESRGQLRRPEADPCKSSPSFGDMRSLTLLSLLAVATAALLALGSAEDLAPANGINDSPNSEAFLSRHESAEVVKRHKRNYGRLYNVLAAAPAVTPDPLEPYREVCELIPGCDELADQIGFREAYQRYYGPI
ncbi:hypothetical protein JRQ81_009580 [Phrynocephalus forsythii]|uniref:Osteocalcin n=1 Tax=Phrynocephalus forsythii TaxID=171643 RepID=A0A9Q0XAZ4_9SAUR|nr:hypothetical protein JRQ81_009580 [Phrynocephalus forsythii]